GLCLEDDEAALFAKVAKGTADPIAVLEQPNDRAFHVNGNSQVNAVILKGADHFQSGAVADVRESRILVAAEIALEDAAVLGAIEHGAPRFQLADAGRSFLRVDLGHAPVVYVLAAPHRVGEVDLPIVSVVDVRQSGGDATFGHDGV